MYKNEHKKNIKLKRKIVKKSIGQQKLANSDVK